MMNLIPSTISYLITIHPIRFYNRWLIGRYIFRNYEQNMENIIAKVYPYIYIYYIYKICIKSNVTYIRERTHKKCPKHILSQNHLDWFASTKLDAKYIPHIYIYIYNVAYIYIYISIYIYIIIQLSKI